LTQAGFVATLPLRTVQIQQPNSLWFKLHPHTQRFISKHTMQTATYGKSAEIRSRIEPDLKKQSTEVLADLGLDLSAAIRLFLRQVVEVGGLPFEVKKPTPETVAAMTEARAMSAVRFDSAKELFDGLDQQTGKGKARAAVKKS
jgi:DNA-damage-inducible protein J